MKLRLIASLVLVLWAMGPFVRDVFPAPTTVIFLGGTTSLVSVIEYDTQIHGYEFQVLPYWAYSIQVLTNTLWDSSVRHLGADGSTIITQTDSAASGQSFLAWTNNGPAGRRYLYVEGFAQFTTGSYALAFQAVAPVDTHGHGLPDAWQQIHFGSVSPTNLLQGDPDGDGMSNGDELLAGTSPSDALSVLDVVRFEKGDENQWQVAWPAVPFGSYELEWTLSLQGPWLFGADLMSPQGGIQTQRLGVVSASNFAVRVKLVY